MTPVEVDGERFEVTERISEPGVYEIRWVSGPHDGYGFATSSYYGERKTEAELEDAIRNFLRQVGPSGYIE
ncbi:MULTISPECIES: hypothetical protein [unclassified Terrabacter]|uniref:hypothetical protein n=1 Tax=unclassified Terrabacter TaxID=2630222 RepID=UPI0006F96FBC|nr:MULTISPECIES: hypothetical protein [unclassified Terrabacter]KRB44858.1 hypothetical protein ASD90_14135 [Terrabacter sp. Root181]KRF41178.1 hypothetical protein ASG96_10465 [Terrabacter sp. Soil810]